MSAYSDWKCGAISDSEYAMYARREESDLYDHIHYGRSMDDADYFDDDDDDDERSE